MSLTLFLPASISRSISIGLQNSSMVMRAVESKPLRFGQVSYKENTRGSWIELSCLRIINPCLCLTSSRMNINWVFCRTITQRCTIDDRLTRGPIAYMDSSPQCFPPPPQESWKCPDLLIILLTMLINVLFLLSATPFYSGVPAVVY